MNNNILKIIDQLRTFALKGQEEIKMGDVYRNQLPDSVFSEVVSPALEDAVIEAMVRSNEWYRAGNGFNLKQET